LAVREDDAEPELLDDESMLLKDGEIVAMAVNELPLIWRTFPADLVTLSEDGAVATHTMDADEYSLTTTGTELTEGKHYWEVELLSKDMGCLFIGISRPNLDPTAHHFDGADGWFVYAHTGCPYGNGKNSDGIPGNGYKQGDRVGVLLDLDNGSLRFFKNGVQERCFFENGSVTGQVVPAVQMIANQSVRLLPNAEAPAGA
jgi:hypothetical protein